MAYEFRRLRRVEFAETDAAGIVHFAQYFRYMEETEHEFLRSLGLTVHPDEEGGTRIGFPRTAVRCEYFRPLRFEDEVEIHLCVARKGRSSVTYHHVLRCKGKDVAQGEVVVVCCRVFPGGRMERVPLPEPYASRLGEAPGAPLLFEARREPPRAAP